MPDARLADASPDAAVARAPGGVPWLARAARPTFAGEIVAFDDNVLYGTLASTRLVYRVEGRGQLSRRASLADDGRVAFGDPSDPFVGDGDGASRDVALVHVAQLPHATLRARLRIDAGALVLAVAHNGRTRVDGTPAETPGVGVVLGEAAIALIDLRTNAPFARIDAALPRGADTDIAVAWDTDARSVRVDLGDASYLAAVPGAVAFAPGGFGLRASPGTRAAVTRARLVDEEPRPIVYLDPRAARFVDRATFAPACASGCAYGGLHLPPAMAAEVTNAGIAAIDLRRGRALYWLVRAADPSAPRLTADEMVGYAVQDLRPATPAPTAVVVTFDARGNADLNGCYPNGGSCGVDGLCLLTGPQQPSSLCWLDWNAYDRGELARFAVPSTLAAHAAQSGFAVGYQDPHQALDGSLAEYVTGPIARAGAPIYQLVRHLTVHPALAPYVAQTDYAFDPPPAAALSHTHPGSDPATALCVRDADRAWAEVWEYNAPDGSGGHYVHVQNLGFNLFTLQHDASGALFYSAAGAPAMYTDYANVVPDVTAPGRGVATLYRWTPGGAPNTSVLAVDVVTAGPAGFVRVGPYGDPATPPEARALPIALVLPALE